MNGAISKASGGDIVLVATGTYTGGSDEVVALTKSVNIEGGWNSTFTAQNGYSVIDGQGAHRGISIGEYVTTTIRRFIIQNGKAYQGGGVFSGGTLVTIEQTIVKDSVADHAGGGIYGGDTLVLNETLISNNRAGSYGGGIYSFFLVATNSAISNNKAGWTGGGIHGNANADLKNVTIYNNSAYNGGGIFADAASTVLNNVTVSNNKAEAIGGGISVNDFAIIKLQNTILANNLSIRSPDCAGNVESQGYNIIKSISGCTIAAQNGDQFNIDPQVGVFLPDPGVLPLLVESPAIDGGNPATCLPTDQRGMARVGACDVGAYEYTVPLSPAKIILVGGDRQRTPPGFGFRYPLQVGIVDVNGSPVSEVNVTFTAPASGPSGAFKNGSQTITLPTGANGVAATTLTANSVLGSYSVMASTAVGSKTFSLENTAWYVTPDGDDVSHSCADPSHPCKTIQKALEKALEDDVILVSTGRYTDVGSVVLHIDKNITVSGGWNISFTDQVGFSTIDGEYTRSGIFINQGAVVAVEKFIVEHGQHGIINDGKLTFNNSEINNNSSFGLHEDGGGIKNRGDLSANNCLIGLNYGANGGGVYNEGNLAINNCLIMSNSAGQGGGIYNSALRGPGIVILNDSIIGNNRAGDGGGIYNYGTIRISRTGINNNASGSRGGGMINFGTATMNNVTVAGNQGGEGGGIWNGGNITWNNSTISSNTSFMGGGIFVEEYGSERLTNTILAGNTASNSGPDCSGKLLSSGTNILGNASSCDMNMASGDRVNINPQLGILLPTEGYIPLLPTSPAINAGNPARCRPTDQRGIARPQGAKCDIGAYEYTVPGTATRLTVANGDRQLTEPGSLFRYPLQIAAVDAKGSPVAGVTVRFQAPANSPSGLFSNTNTKSSSAITGNGGIAQAAPFRADRVTGTYRIVASVAGIPGVSFSLHNGAWLVSPNGSDSNDCLYPESTCASLTGVLNKIEFQDDDPVWMAVGTYGSTGDHTILGISRTVNVYGGWNPGFTNQIGTSVIQDMIELTTRINVSLNKITIQNTGSYGIRTFANLLVKDSTIRNNRATGIENSGHLTILNSTITQNGDSSLHVGQGGIFNTGSDSTSTVVIVNSTITQNKGNTVGGVRNYFTDTQPIRIHNSIIAGNISLYGSDSPDCSGEFISDGYNIIGNLNASQCEARWQNTDLVGSRTNPINPMLNALRDFGNNVWVQPLRLGSPAIDAGSWNCDPVDQRGVARPQGGSCDIGAFEYVFQHNANGLLLTTYTAGNSLNPFRTKVCDQTDLACRSGDVHAKAAHKYAAGAYNLYKNSHNRNSLDNQGIEILSSVHYGRNYQNAFWNGHMMIYGDQYGYPLADDVVAHEFTHGVTQYESNLFYYYQSGAINESFSDLWGEYYDQSNGLGNDSSTVKWLIGENVSGQGAIRNMRNPLAYQDPDKMSSSLYYEGNEDSGGVHTNSGVNNKAVFLMVNGGTFNGKTVTALGWAKTAAIYYEVNTNLLSSGADYSDLYYALQKACSNLIGQKGITTGNCAEVKDAIDAVEMNSQPAPRFNTHAPLCTVKGTAPQILFADDLETGTQSWTFSNGTYRRWQWDSPYGPYAQSGHHSLYADDYPDGIADASARLATLTIPTNAYLHFAQAYDFERGHITGNPTLYNFDGGVLEYSINNGAIWRDAGSLIDYNGYKGRIYSLYGNPLGGRSAFVGSSHGYISTRLNLASLAGKRVSFRWRMGLDNGGYAWGWWVDNIKVYTCGAP
jgi:hypothetical protein